ncbi:hypothetical protein ACIA9I_12405 [Streptomyces anulatus]
MQLPEQPVAGQPDPTIQQNAARFLAAVDEALLAGQSTSYRDDTPLPAVGSALPVAQPGPPPMSQWAIDVSGVLKAVSVVSLPIGVAVWIVGQVDPLTLGIVLGSPAAVALAVARLVAKVKDANQAAQPVTNHFHGTVHHDERTVISTTRGVIANNRNQHPRD